MWPQIILNGFVLGTTIALLAAGLTVIFGILRIVNFAHGEAYMFGAVIFYYCVVTAGVNPILASIIAVAAVGILGWGLDRSLIRRFHGNLMGGVIATLGFLLIFQNMMWLIVGPIPRAVPSIVSGEWQIFGAVMPLERLVITGVSLMAVGVLVWFMHYTKLGKSMRAVQQDAEAALSLGISVDRVSALAFGVGTGLAALAGAIIGPVYSVHPMMGTTPLLLSFIVIILGGMGSVMGAFIASIIIGLQQSLIGSLWGPHLAMGISFGLALVILLFLPRGFMGHD